MRLQNATPAPWATDSIGCKNYLLWVGGNWPETDDDANFEFIANARKDMEILTEEIEKLSFEISKLKKQIAKNQQELESN